MATLNKTKEEPQPWKAEVKPVVVDRSIYNTKRWRKDRAAHIARNPLCVECLSKGMHTAARVSDHIMPITQGGSVWSWDNRQALCDVCHNSKRGREAHTNQKGRGGSHP